MKFFYINNERCTECNRCIDSCPTGAVYVFEGAHHINYDKCVSCGTCMKSCTSGAISLERMEALTVELGKLGQYKSRMQQLERDVALLREQVAAAKGATRQVIDRLPVAALLADRQGRVAVANRPLFELLAPALAPTVESVDALAGSRLDSLLGDYIYHLFRQAALGEEIADLIADLGGRQVSVSFASLHSGGLILGLVSDLSRPDVVGGEIARRLRETIDLKMAMVQKIGFLLGEEGSEVVKKLNSIIKMVEGPHHAE
ncbi:MAG: 4Fe-4S binding protein [Rikenellaceae bacterium]|nr:4Fe-4S binding protein [Rikenellaceae bacterium]